MERVGRNALTTIVTTTVDNNNQQLVSETVE